jgi:predicted dehydrogenase
MVYGNPILRDIAVSEGKLRVAVVGLGKMGLVHSSVLNVLPRVQLVAVCEKNGMIRKFAKKLFSGVEVLDDVGKLSAFDLDAVYVTTPILSHFQVVKTVLSDEVASNVFVEKTLCQRYEESRLLCDLARNIGGVNMVGYLRRFYVTFGKARSLLSERAIGDPLSFRAYAYSSDFYGTKELASRGGVLRDLGCYAIDLALWFFKDVRVDSRTSAGPSQQVSNEMVSFEFLGDHGLAGHFDISWFVPNYRMPEIGFLVKGTEGEVLVSDDKVELKPESGDSVVWYRHNLSDGVPFCLGLPEYYREDSHFIDCILKKETASPDFSAASDVDRVICQVEENGGGNNQQA